MLQNQNGEADYNVWFHCMMSCSRNVIILGSDTDIWVYCMALLECGWMENKEGYVEKTLAAEYIHLNTLYFAALEHPQLSNRSPCAV